MTKTDVSIKKRLEYHYKKFNNSNFTSDPIEFPHRFKNYYDIEISALLSSLLAYGNISQIKKSLGVLHSIMENRPNEFVKNYKNDRLENKLKSYKHRFYSNQDIINLFKVLNRIYINYDSLNYLFLLYYSESEVNLKNTISAFSNNMIGLFTKEGQLTKGIKFMFPDPIKGSACKRMNLFLRWMIRKDKVDFGLWNGIPTFKIIIPVDTHVYQIAKELKFTKRKIISWNMAEEITENLKRFDALDPIKYDFALCHLGVQKIKF